MRSLLFVLTLSLALPAAGRPATGPGGMVATAHPAASEAGVAMLRKGGNAVDAAVASAFALAVAEPYSSGIGGGGFALVRFGEELLFLDFREVAPRKATREMYRVDGEPRPDLSRDGITSVAVPGAVAGYLDLHARFGKLPRRQVLEPAIRLARDGFEVDSTYRMVAGFRLELLRRDPEATRIFLVDGDVPPLGHRLRQPDLASTLELLAKEGADAFYRGSIARQLAADMKARGGLIDREDLETYRVQTRTPLVGSYRGHAIATAPPPSAGGQVLLTVLGALEELPAQTPRHAPEALHLYIEALKRAYADRALFGDPAFVDVPVAPLVAPKRARALARGIGYRASLAEEVPPAQFTPLQRTGPGGGPTDDGQDTTHLSVVDAQGNAVSLTSTVNYAFGAGVVAKGTGVLWNDEMDDFSIAPGVPNAFGVVGSEANAIAPGKIPLSSMAPTIVFSGPTIESPVRLVVGSPGGPRIPTTILQVIQNHLAYGLDVERAIAMGRVHHQHLPDQVSVEPFALEPATRGLLELRGHRVVEGRRWSNATAISIDPETGLRSGAADPRGIGTAVAQ